MSSSHDETSLTLNPRYDAQGLVVAMAADANTGQPLMVAYMNAEALRLTLETGEAHFYSRSRQEIWHKGGTSGNTLAVREVRVDCDQDAIWMRVDAQGHGAACHTGRKSCFYRRVVLENGEAALVMDEEAPLFDPKDVYTG
ncbi:MAG: phosphoribosyl-AMP cyclohydrolase [Pseudomonadota bacterium]